MPPLGLETFTHRYVVALPAQDTRVTPVSAWHQEGRPVSPLEPQPPRTHNPPDNPHNPRVNQCPVLFTIYINDVDVGLNNRISKFADDTKIGNSVLSSFLSSQPPPSPFIFLLPSPSFLVHILLDFSVLFPFLFFLPLSFPSLLSLSSLPSFLPMHFLLSLFHFLPSLPFFVPFPLPQLHIIVPSLPSFPSQLSLPSFPIHFLVSPTSLPFHLFSSFFFSTHQYM